MYARKIYDFSTAYEIADFLTGKGYASIYVPRDSYGDIDVLIKKPFAFFSHKHAAYLSGLGSFGQNNVLLTPEYGPRVRFVSIFTNAEVEGDSIKTKDLCIKCLACVRECPVNAIKQEGDFPPPMDKMICARGVKSFERNIDLHVGFVLRSAQLEMIEKYVIGKIHPYIQKIWYQKNLKEHGNMLEIMEVKNNY